MTTTTTPADLTSLVNDTTDALAGGASPTLRPRVEARLVAGSNTEVSITAGKHAFTIDEPAALAGEDNGASPVEHLLASLAACQIITFKVWAAKLGITLDSVSAELSGEIDLRGFFGVEDVRPGFGGITIDITVTGPESQETYDELVSKVMAHCPVLDNLTSGLPVTPTVRIAA